MIEFDCPSCSKRFSVPDNYVGKKARCKRCGGGLTIPPPTRAPIVRAATLPLRTRRLMADARQLAAAFAGSKVIEIRPGASNGAAANIAPDPSAPDRYEVVYHLRGLEGVDDAGEPIARDVHRVELALPEDYPRAAPRCRVLTVAFHPNLHPDRAEFHMADRWTAGERLTDVVVRVGEMLAYQRFDADNAVNEDAALWTRLNAAKLPLDAREIRSAQLQPPAAAQAGLSL